MLYPSINELLKLVDNRYALVIAVAKRARMIVEENQVSDNKIIKPVSVATNEIYESKLKIIPVDKNARYDDENIMDNFIGE